MRDRNRDHAERNQDDVSRDHSSGFASEHVDPTGVSIGQGERELPANKGSISKTNLRRCRRVQMKGKAK
jgi:hypothetical protein